MDIEQIWQEHQTKLYAFIRSKISNECDAKDLLQQLFLKIHEKQDTLRDQKKAVSWIYQITRNAVTDYYRTHKRTVELNDI